MIAYQKKVVIVGLGNLLMKDDGIGIHVVRRLNERDLPFDAEVIDGATFVLHLLPVFQDAEKVLIIDAVKSDGAPGDMYRLTPEDLVRNEESALSLHQVGFLDVYDTAKRLGKCAQILIIGIEPAEIAWGMELSPVLEEKLDEITETVIHQMEIFLDNNGKN